MLNLKPTYFVDGTIEKLSIDALIKDGVKGLILDLDNTIMLPGSGCFCNIVKPWLQEAQAKGLKLIIVTNNKNEQYLGSFESVLAELDLKMFIKAKKPNPGKLLEAIKELDLPCEQICIVGDRVLTDVWGGVRVKTKTAFVKPLLGKKENLLFQLLRKMEKLCLHSSHW